MGVTPNKVAGRKCEVKSIDKTIAKQFLVENHLKGSSVFATAIGLFFNEELVHVTTFGSSRFDVNYNHEIIRSASKMETNIIGGFSKCLKFYIKNYCVSGEAIMTYADRSISEGNSYLKAGFNLVRTTGAGYHYVERGNGDFIVHSRYKFQKHKLKDFSVYSDTKSEWEIMIESGYDRFWDSGNNLYEYFVK